VDTGVVQVPHEFASRVRKIAERFREIMHFSTQFSLSEDDGEKRLFTPDSSSFRQTSSFLLEKRVVRRDKEKDMIVDKLLCGEERNQGSHVSVLAIVGLGGLGKTTLAQLVYNDLRLCHSFDKHAWVYVSEHFDINAITSDIINSLTRGTCEFTELADLQEKFFLERRQKLCRIFIRRRKKKLQKGFFGDEAPNHQGARSRHRKATERTNNSKLLN
jgi:hypothetical protein